MANTSVQNVAWSRWTDCHKEVTGTELKSVQPDGRISFWYSGTGDGRSMLECLQQATRTGASLPEAIAEARPGGSGGGGAGGGM